MSSIITPSMERLVRYARCVAASSQIDYFGVDATSRVKDKIYFEQCKHLHRPTGSFFIFTRDFGHHSSGWIKNPDYERCFHLSLSFWDMAADEKGLRVSLPHDRELAALWCRAFFRDKARWLWTESPKSVEGRINDVWHYRLFCDERWKPILPKGEVYHADGTPVDWKSWSEVHPELAKPEVPTSMLPDGGDV